MNVDVTDLKDALSLVEHSQFTYENLMNLRDTRFTLFDLLPLFGSGRTHKHLVNAVDMEWADESDAPVVISVERSRYETRFAVETRLLTHIQVMRLMSRMTAETGRRARRDVQRYMDALEALAIRQQAALEAERARADRYKMTYHETFSLFRSFTTTRLIMKGLDGLSKEDMFLSAKEDEAKWRTACGVAGVKSVPGQEFEALEAVIESRTKKGLLGLGS